CAGRARAGRVSARSARSDLEGRCGSGLERGAGRGRGRLVARRLVFAELLEVLGADDLETTRVELEQVPRVEEGAPAVLEVVARPRRGVVEEAERQLPFVDLPLRQCAPGDLVEERGVGAGVQPRNARGWPGGEVGWFELAVHAGHAVAEMLLAREDRVTAPGQFERQHARGEADRGVPPHRLV